VASVAEVKAAIDAAMLHVQEGQLAVRSANEQLGEAQLNLATAVEGSGHEAVATAQAALAQATTELQECLIATLLAMDQAETYVATL
jgi:F0F1-type ATP synthase membrane subunit b/b'